MRYINTLLLLVAFMFVMACSTAPKVVEAPQPEPTPPAPQPVVLEVPTENVLYFDHDSSEIKPAGFEILDAIAAYLNAVISDNPNFVADIEGHTDIIGDANYNTALGTRRAEAVARYLRVRGVPSDNLRIQSYGETEPAILGNLEVAYSRNRRVVLTF